MIKIEKITVILPNSFVEPLNFTFGELIRVESFIEFNKRFNSNQRAKLNSTQYEVLKFNDSTKLLGSVTDKYSNLINNTEYCQPYRM
ncbi:hypothetical protein GCM10023331_11390 [Algivirga pacifica]|uniref:Uncharacterized protein n=1 Tax=Algivirga pacifica TaxID=1162670 RepID=A0ABP9D9X1_9BACT